MTSKTDQQRPEDEFPQKENRQGSPATGVTPDRDTQSQQSGPGAVQHSKTTGDLKTQIMSVLRESDLSNEDQLAVVHSIGETLRGNVGGPSAHGISRPTGEA